MNNDLFQLGNEIEWQDLGNGVQRQIFGYDNQVMMVKVKFDLGAIGELHHHHHIQLSYVESGVFETTIGAHKKILKHGDGFYVPDNEIHGVVCLEAGMLIDVFSPHREDFL